MMKWHSTIILLYISVHVCCVKNINIMYFMCDKCEHVQTIQYVPLYALILAEESMV